MATKKKSSQKAPKKAPRKKTTPKPTPPAENPFSGRQVLIQQKGYQKNIDPQSGAVSELYVDPSGRTSYWVYTGEYVVVDPSSVNRPPAIGGIPAEMYEQMKADAFNPDSILVASAISFCDSSNTYNNSRYEAAVDAVVAWQRRGRAGTQPAFPKAPELDPSKWIKGVAYYRPANFDQVYRWMVDHDAGRNPDSVAAQIPLPPDVGDYNQG